MTTSSDTAVAPAPEATTQRRPGGAELTELGLAYLRGHGKPRDEGMAVASLLDAADLDHPPAVLLCALCYFAGIGVTRNTQTAAEYATKYLQLAPGASDAAAARDIIDGTLGTERARSMLADDAPANGHASVAASKSRVPMIAGAVAVVAVLAGGAAFMLLRNTPGAAPNPTADIAALIPAAELEAARKDALAIALRINAETTAAMKQAEDAKAQASAQQADTDEQARLASEKAAQDAQQEKDAQAEQLRQAQEQARAAEARATAQAAELEAARQRASQQASRSNQTPQLRSMYSAAVEALKQGEYDRASGLVDGMLALAPNHPQVLQLKASIQQAKRDALNRMRVE
jgi:hypothetical protein